MKRFLILLILSFFSLQSYAGSCPDGSDPVRSISADGTFFVYNCAGSNNDTSSSASSISNKNTSEGIDRFGGDSEIPEEANPNDETLKFYLYRYLYSHNIYPYCGNPQELFCEDMPPQFSHPIEASNNPYQFNFELREDRYIKEQMQDTPLLSYLLYEDGKIVNDVITPKDRFGDMFRDSSKFHSQSVAKTLIGYVAGHAICKGYIDSVDSRLNDWPVLENTLYHNQKLIDVLNMASGTQEYFIGANKFKNSSRSVTNPTVKDAMENELKGSKKSSSIYNYNNMNPNVVGSYLIYKLGDENFQALLDDVFKKKARIEGDVFFLKNISAKKDDISLFSQFYATRYDYLRIAKAMLDDWENDTCAGKYLKTIYERKINKGNWGGKDPRITLPEGYAGFFHTGYKGMGNRPVMSMDGYGGQTITIDFEKGRIIATQAIHDNMMFPKPGGYDWKKIVYERIKNGKPASNIKAPPEIIVDSQQIIKERNAAIETEKKAKKYWDDYYDCAETISGKSNIEACMKNIHIKKEKERKCSVGNTNDESILLKEDFDNLDQCDLNINDQQNQWFTKKENDGNTMYCNKAANNWTEFMFGSHDWTNYSISYQVKLSSSRQGFLETHTRKDHNGGAQYRAIHKIPGRASLEFAHPSKKINQEIASGARAVIGDKWSDIQLIASGDNIKYLVNGKVVASTNDDRAKEGAVMIAASANLEICIDNIVAKKEIAKKESEESVVKEIKEDKFSSEKTELFKNIKSSDALDGFYSFTLVQSPMTQLGSGSLEINNGIVTITQDSKGIVTPSYASFEGRIDQNGDIKALFYFHPCSGCEDKLVEFNGNLNKKNLRGKYNDTQINFYLTAKKGDVIKVETKTVETKKVITSDSDPTVSKVIEVTHGDKLIIDIAEPHELAGSNIKVSLKDIDAPDATRSCPKQLELGEEVRDYVAKKLKNASNIKLTNFRKTNTKIIAQVIVDGVDLGEELVSKGFASEEYGFWKPYFCSALSATNQADQYVDTDQKKAIFWYERSIVLDPDGSKNQESHFLLSKMYSNLGDNNKSLENLKKSASLEWVPAMEKLGSNYLNGSGVKKDSNQGKKWLKKAFDKGSTVAEGMYCGSLPKAKQKTCKF
jgi:endonuclease YncB( thermonuclease family)